MVIMTLEDSIWDRLDEIVLSGAVFSEPFRRSGQFLFSRPHQCLSPRWMPISSRKSFGRPRLWARTLLSIVGFHLELCLSVGQMKSCQAEWER